MTGFTWAPVYVSYGNNNRTHMVRIPMNSPRVESRAVDMATNPYLGATMMLAAGLEGIEQELDPGDPIPQNMYLQSDAELREAVSDVDARYRPRRGRTRPGDRRCAGRTRRVRAAAARAAECRELPRPRMPI
jgi:glutamine synthetase